MQWMASVIISSFGVFMSSSDFKYLKSPSSPLYKRSRTYSSYLSKERYWYTHRTNKYACTPDPIWSAWNIFIEVLFLDLNKITSFLLVKNSFNMPHFSSANAKIDELQWIAKRRMLFYWIRISPQKVVSAPNTRYKSTSAKVIVLRGRHSLTMPWTNGSKSKESCTTIDWFPVEKDSRKQ